MESRFLAVRPSVAAALVVCALHSVRAAPGVSGGQPAIQLANRFLSSGRYRDAVSAFERAIRARTDDRRAWSGMVTALLRAGDFSRAQVESEKLFRLAPNDADATALYADGLWAAGRFDEAADRYGKAVALAPASARGHLGVAKTLVASNKLEQAIVEARAAIAADSNTPEAYETMAYAYERMRQYPEAADALREYLSRMPHEDATLFADRVRSQAEFFESFDHRLPYAVDAAAASLRHAIDFKLVDGKIIVQARVNGGAPQDFIVDTGAEQVVLSRWTASHLGVYAVTSMPSAGIGERGVQELQQARIATLTLGRLQIKNVPCLIREPAPRTPAITERLSPIAMGFSTVIDYAGRKLLLADDLQDHGTDESIELPLWMYRLPIVGGMVDSRHPAGFVVDTGGEAVSISRSAAADLGRPEPAPKVRLKVFGASGPDRTAYLMPFVHLAFGPVRLANYSVAVLDLDMPSALLGFRLGGVVGYDLLRRYRVTFDLRRGVLRLTANRAVT